MKPLLLSLLLLSAALSFAQRSGPVSVKRTDDFDVTGDGKNIHWEKASWVEMPLILGEDIRHASYKTLYSKKGIYFLFHSEDEKLNAKKTEDFDSLWKEDVVEVFLWPDTTQTIYFEYELSPLNHELAVLIPNLNKHFLGWRPWFYEGERKTRHAVSIQKDAGNKMKGWYGEVFIPFTLLYPLGNISPGPGTQWRANTYRVDYDKSKTSEWAWKKVEGSFHQFRKFGTLRFE